MMEARVQRGEWSEDETCLALDLYLKSRGSPTKGGKDVRGLSDLLRQLSHAAGRTVDDTYRNHAGVYMKVMNFRRLDPRFTDAGAKGLAHGARMEEVVWEKYRTHAPDLASRVAFLRTRAKLSEAAQPDEANDDPHVFVTGFWSFDPAREGYIGFTHEATRTRYLEESRSGDLMLVVGVSGKASVADNVGRCLGLVELGRQELLDQEAADPTAYAAKVLAHGADKWKYALPIKRAWRVEHEIKASHIVPETYTHANAQMIGMSFKRLSQAEAARVMELRIKPVPVWGQGDWAETEDVSPEIARTFFKKGPPPSVGTRTSDYNDGETVLYLMVLQGPVDALFPDLRPASTGKLVVKVGRTNDPKRREKELNWALPPGATLRWKLSSCQRFSSVDEADEAETRLLEDLHAKGLLLDRTREFAVIKRVDELVLLVPYVGRNVSKLV